MEYTLIDPEEDCNMDYNISDAKYQKLSSVDQAKYEVAESFDDDDFDILLEDED
jgi:hypothetical protein